LAYSKISSYNYADITAFGLTAGVVVIKKTVVGKNNYGGHYNHAFGTAAISAGVLFAAGF
jgi:hypothetical protein